jgi:hypothetical protein
MMVPNDKKNMVNDYFMYLYYYKASQPVSHFETNMIHTMETPLHSSSYLLFINLQTFSLEFNILFVILITHLFHYNHYPLVPLQILKNQSYIQNIVVSNRIIHHHSIIYTKEQPTSHFETNTNSYINWTTHKTGRIKINTIRVTFFSALYNFHIDVPAWH